MSKHIATVHWQRDQQVFIDSRYSRAHQWQFDGGVSVAASSSPDVVPLPYSVEENVDPEEAFIASLSSCHMLFFLSIAAKKRWCVDQYIDQAYGEMGQNAAGKQAMLSVVLRPSVKFAGDAPSDAQIAKAHHQAHDLCFLANSVNCEIVIETS